MTDWSVALAALYLRGAPREGSPPRGRGWQVLAALRRAGATASMASECLADACMWPESLLLDTPGLLSWAKDQVARDSVITAAEDAWPPHLSACPPAFWRSGVMPCGETITIVGSRRAPSLNLSYCREVAWWAAQTGLVVWSGGAAGCDRAAAFGAGGRVVELLPHGLSLAVPGRGALLSLASPEEHFSPGLAMERNALLYAVSSLVLVGHVRYREGGTWHSAVDALRRHRVRIAVFDDGSQGSAALRRLGAAPVSSVADVATLFAQPGASGRLFG